VVLVSTFSLIFELPLKLKDMMNIFFPLSTNYTPLDLILNDSFVKNIKEKKKICTIWCIYDEIVAFQFKVNSFF